MPGLSGLGVPAGGLSVLGPGRGGLAGWRCCLGTAEEQHQPLPFGLARLSLGLWEPCGVCGSL